MNAILLDSTVLIYAIDPRNLLKQERAIAVLAAFNLQEWA